MTKEVYNKRDMDTIIAQLLGSLIAIRFVCEKLKSKGKRKIDVDIILGLTDKVLSADKVLE